MQATPCTFHITPGNRIGGVLQFLHRGITFCVGLIMKHVIVYKRGSRYLMEIKPNVIDIYFI